MFYNFYMSKFSIRLQETRKDKGISRKDLAEHLNVSVRLISYWENGERECDFDTLIKIADYFDESVDFLLGRIDY